jgi:hypothetical protein
LKCPTCGGPVDAKRRRGLIINQRAFLSSRLIPLKDQYEKNKNRCPNDIKGSIEWSMKQVALGEQIIAMELELEKLRVLETS